MKLNSSGVVVSILILIIMMLICHSMNFFYPKNNFIDIDSDRPKQTDYNEIYYTNDLNKKQLCANVNQAEIPCDIVRTCKTEPNKRGLDSLSNSEIAVLYKVAYEESAREIFTRTLKEIPTTTQSNIYDLDY